MTDPTFTDQGSRAVVRIERALAHPIERVWDAVTRPEHLRHWFPTEVTFELRPGGVVRYAWDGGEADGADPSFGEVLEVEPPTLLAFTWGDDRLRVELAAEGDGTRMVLVHDFADRAGGASFAAGWEACLAALVPVMEGGPLPEPEPMVDRHEELVRRFGLDQPTVHRDGGAWMLRWERQLTCPAEVAWDLFLGGSPAPAVGEAFRAPAAPEVELGTATDVTAPAVLAFDVATDEPGDHLRFELVDGTGQGARLVLTVTGRDPADEAIAAEQWGTGAVAHVAEGAVAWAHARPVA